MKFVAAAKLRRAQENALAARPYAKQLTRVLQSALLRIENPQHPLLERREEKSVLALVVSGDKGLCGAFNTNVLRRTLEFRSDRASLTLHYLPIGKRGRDALRKRKFEIVDEYVGVLSKADRRLAQEVAAKVVEMYSAGKVDAVYAIFNEFRSVLVQRMIVQQILPIAPDAAASEPAGGSPVDYLYEQPGEELLGKLLPRYVETQVIRAIFESVAAENAARMTAMDSATNNAKELIEKLTLHMNKVRQAAITKEIIEVVSGAASTA